MKRDAINRHKKPVSLNGNGSAKRIKGATADAKTLGVTRSHLSKVLHGHIISKRLTRRYQELKASQPTEQARKAA